MGTSATQLDADSPSETVTTDDFIAFAEALSGQELSDLFEAWLFTPSKPSVDPSP